MSDPRTAREFFSSHVPDYDATHYGAGVRSFMTVRQRRMLELIDAAALPPGARVLDAGCGPGHLLLALAERGYDAWALDASPAMLATTRARLAGAGVGDPRQLVRSDIEMPPFADASFDMVCSAGVIEYLATDERVLAAFSRILRPGGLLVLPTTNQLSPAGWLDAPLEALKRREWFLRPVNRWLAARGAPAVRARAFRVRRHRPVLLRRALSRAGFALRDELFFHFLPWPHPFDRVFPRATTWLGEPMERWARTALGALGEGYLTLSVKGGRGRT